jgi:hypothetical protein
LRYIAKSVLRGHLVEPYLLIQTDKKPSAESMEQTRKTPYSHITAYLARQLHMVMQQ